MKGLTGHFRDQSKIRALRCSVHTEPDLTRKKILFRFNRFFFFSRSKIRPVPCEHSSNLLKFHGYTQEPITWYTLIFNPHGLFYIIDCRRKMNNSLVLWLSWLWFWCKTSTKLKDLVSLVTELWLINISLMHSRKMKFQRINIRASNTKPYLM